MAGASKEDEGRTTTKRIAGVNISQVAYSFAKKVGIVAGVYILGYYGISVAWLIGPVILSVIRETWKKEKDLKRNIAKAAAMCNEKEVILARVDDLPSWVFFPDVERAEWLNRILRQVWPNMNHFVKELLKESIEPNLRDSLAAYKLNGFRFEKMILGDIPLRIGGMKVYDRNVDRNEIILDMDLFYAGDCDISFSLGGIKGGIKDLQIHGMMRVVMKPLIAQMPLVGGLQLFFLNNPTIDFDLVGVADLLDMPGLSDILRRVIVEQVANMMVLPNKFPIRLSDAVPALSLKTPEPEGVLRVHVVEAKDLMKKDISMLGKGKSDPYAVVSVGAQEFRTQTIDNNVNPKWDYWCEFEVYEPLGQTVQVRLFDADDMSKKDEPLGRATVDVNSVVKQGQVDLWVTLEEAKHGRVHLRMTWLKLSSNIGDLKAALEETQMLRLTSMSSAILMIFVDCAKNLREIRPMKKPDPFAVLSVGKRQEQTMVKFKTGDPVWEQGFTFLVHDPQADTLHIKVVDKKTALEIGTFDYNLSTLMEIADLEVTSQPFRLTKCGPDSKINVSMQLRILKFASPSKESSEEPELKDGADMSEKLAREIEQLGRADSFKKPATPSKSVEASPIRKQGSKESLQSSSSASQLPVEDIMIVSSPPAPLSSAPGGGEIRNRSPGSTTSNGECGLGRIQLTLRYSVQRQRLVIVIHKIANLPLKDPANIPDPYVKLYLLPERSKDSKRKTEAVKDNCNPVYDETFEYVISQGEVNSKQLEVSVVTRKGIFSSGSPLMGQVVVNLNDLEPPTRWYDLQPERVED